MSIQALGSRAAGNKHLEITHKISCFFKKSRTVEKEGNNKAASFAEKGPKKCTQTSVELTFASSEVANAEIRWTVFSKETQTFKTSVPSFKLCFQNAELPSCFL